MRIEKVAILNEVTARVKDSDYCFILNYGGVDVVKIGAFRAALKGHDSRLLISLYRFSVIRIITHSQRSVKRLTSKPMIIL